MIFFLQNLAWRLEDFIVAGGLVMIPLLLLSILLWVLIINRVIFFHQLYKKNMSRKEAVAYIEANQMPDPHRHHGAVALLVSAFLRHRSGNPDLDRFILDETVVSLVASLKSYLPLIGVLAAIAPLLGLLGTVTGMLVTFDVISVFGTGNVKALASGISEALISTQTGLLVAIPGLYMSSFLNRRAENLQNRIAAVAFYLHRGL